MTKGERLIRSYLSNDATRRLTDHTLQSFIGMVETGEATWDDIRQAGGEPLVRTVREQQLCLELEMLRDAMSQMLSTRDLVARMTPTALAEMIVSIEQAGNLDAAEMSTVYVLRAALARNIGDEEAAVMVDAAQG